jgi:hypothetical protein
VLTEGARKVYRGRRVGQGFSKACYLRRSFCLPWPENPSIAQRNLVNVQRNQQLLIRPYSKFKHFEAAVTRTQSHLSHIGGGGDFSSQVSFLEICLVPWMEIVLWYFWNPPFHCPVWNIAPLGPSQLYTNRHVQLLQYLNLYSKFWVSWLRLTSSIITNNFVALVREWTIPTEWPPLVGEISVNFSG